MNTQIFPTTGVAPLLPALAFFFCFHLPTKSVAQSCNSIPVAAPLFKTSTSFTSTPSSDIAILSTVFSGKWAPTCGADACLFVYRLKASLPANAEVTVLSGQGWLTANASTPTVLIDPTRDAIQATFNAQLAGVKGGPAIVLKIKVPKGNPGGADLFRNLDGIVQVDIIAPNRMAASSSDAASSDLPDASLPFPNPANSELHWANLGESSAECRLFDLDGKLVARQDVAPAGRLRLDTQALPAGVYLLHCRTAGSSPQRYKVCITH